MLTRMMRVLAEFVDMNVHQDETCERILYKQHMNEGNKAAYETTLPQPTSHQQVSTV